MNFLGIKKKLHVIKMLTAIEIMKKSDNVVLSCDSNTSDL